MQEEIVRAQEEADARCRDRVAQLEREKEGYEKRLRDKYADMAKELEDRAKADSEHYQQKAEDVLEEHQIRERDIQARVEKERREFEGQVLRKAEQLISEYKDAASKAAEKAADEIRENRAREMELMHQAELNRIEFEQAVKAEADSKIASQKELVREAELKAEQLRGAMEQREFELLRKQEAAKAQFESSLTEKSNDTVAHFKEIAQKAVERADAERAAFQSRDLDMQKAFEERRVKYETEAEERAQRTIQEYKDKLREAQSTSEDAQTLLHAARLDTEREFERRKTTYEEDVAGKAQSLIAQYKKAATDAEDKLNQYRMTSQQEEAERLREAEASRIAYEKEINDRSAQIIKEYKDMAETALAKVEQERLGLNEREMELQRQADQVVLKRERELTDTFDTFKATFESEMRRRADEMIAEYKEQAAKAQSKLEAERQRFNLRSAEGDRKFEAARKEYMERADSQVDAAREQAMNAEKETERLRAEFADKQADIETRVEDRSKMLLDEYKTAARNAETKLQTREREWEQLEVSLRARIEEAKRESQNAADAVVAQYKEAAHLAEMRLSDERLAAQARELDESRKQDLARQEYERNVMNKSGEIVEAAKDEVRALKLQLQKEQTAFAERERQLALDHERARQSQEHDATKKANDLIARYQTEVKASIERAREERTQQAAELQRKSEEMVLQYQKIAQDATMALDSEKEEVALKEAERAKQYENQRIEFEADCRRKADAIVKEHLAAAQRTKEAAEVERREAQQMLREAQTAAEAGRQAFESQLRSKANEMVDEYKRLAKEAQEKAEAEHVAMQRREMEITREAELGKQAYEAEVQRKATELVEQYKNLAAKAREDVEREKSVLQEQVRSAQKDMEMERRAFEEEVKRRATSRIKEFEDEAKAARAEHEEERSRLKLLEMDMAKELEVRQTAFEAEVRKKANEAVDVFKKLAKEAQDKAESERAARTTRELELTARFDEMKAQIEADAMRRGNELVEEYKKRAQQAENAREQHLASERAKMDADMADFRRTVDDEMKARELQLKARYEQQSSELDAKSRQVEELRVSVAAEKRAAEDQMNQKFAAKSREVESQANAEIAEAKRMLEVEKTRLEAELEQKKRDMEAAFAAQEAAMRERSSVQQKSLEEGLRRRAADEKSAFEAERERLAAEMRATTEKMEAEKRRHEDEVKDRYSTTLKEVEARFHEERSRLEDAVTKAGTDALRELKAKEATMEMERANYESVVRDKYTAIMKEAEEQHRQVMADREAALEQERGRMTADMQRNDERLKKLQAEHEEKTRTKYDSMRVDLETTYNGTFADMTRKMDKERDQFESDLRKAKDEQIAEQKRRVDEVAGMREKMSQTLAEGEERVNKEVAAREALEEDCRNRMEMLSKNLKTEYETQRRLNEEAMREKCDKIVNDTDAKVASVIAEREDKERRAWEAMQTDQAEFLRKQGEEKAKYEGEIRATYDRLLEEHNAQMTAEREAQQKKETEASEQRAAQELQRLREIEFKKAEFEEDVRARYEDKVRDLERTHEQQYDNLRKSIDGQRDELEKEYLAKDAALKKRLVESEEKIRESFDEKMLHQQELYNSNYAEMSRVHAKERRLRELASIELEESLRSKYEQLLYNQEEAFKQEMNQYKESLERERERLEVEHREKIKVAQLSTAAYEEDVRERYSKMMAETNEQCRQIIAERETKDREEWKKREEELVERQREMEMARIAYEDQLRGQFTELLQRAEENAREAQRQFEEKIADERKAEAEASMERELSLQKEQLDFEQQVWAKYEDMRKGYEEETNKRMDDLKENLAAEKERIARQQIEMKAAEKVNMAEFEAKVHEEYDRRVQEFLEMERKVWDDKERLAQEERDRQDAANREKMRQLDIARVEFEDEVRQKYQALMAQEKEHWQQLEEERGRRTKDAQDRMEKEYHDKRIQDDIDRKEFEQKCLSKYEADKRTLDEEQRTAIRKLEAQHVQLRVDMEKAEMERKAQDKADMFEYEENLRQRCEEEKRAVESEMKAEMQKRESKMAEDGEKFRTDMREKERQMSMRMLEIEDECREKYDQLLEQEKENIRGEFASQAYQVNLENERRHDVEVRTQAMQLQSEKEAFEEQTRNKYKEMLTEAEGKWKAQSDSLAGQLDEERASKQSMMIDRNREDEAARHDYEQKCLATFDEQRAALIKDHEKLVETIKGNAEKDRTRLEETHAKTVAEMQQQLVEFEEGQRKNYDEKLDEYQKQLTKEREKLEGEFRELQEKERQARLDYEREVRAKYEARQAESERVAAQAIKERDEEEEARRQEMEKHHLEYELQCQEKYHALLKEKEEFNERMLRDRAQNMEEMAEKRREDENAREKEREEQRVQYDAELQAKFEKMRTDVLAEADQLRASMEAKDLAQREAWEQLEQEKQALELKARKLKHASTMWRLDYQKETKFKYERMLVDMETRSERMGDEEARSKLLDAESRAAVVPMPVPTPVESRMSKTPEESQASNAGQYQAMQESMDAERRQGQSMLVGLRKRIQELWAVLESDPSDRLHFVMDAEAAAACTPEMIQVYQREISRLTDQLPLMETITRREFIKYRLNELKGAPSARGSREDKQKTEFLRELKRLNEQLMKALPAYEKKHGTMFLFKGKQYLEVMQSDELADAVEAPAGRRSGRR
jgi:hypothetical protein